MNSCCLCANTRSSSWKVSTAFGQTGSSVSESLFLFQSRQPMSSVRRLQMLV